MKKSPSYIPRDYQRDALNAAINYFIKGGRGNPLVVAPTGAGKSIIIAELCRKIQEMWPKKKILVISHNAEILSQNHGKLVEQMPGTRIGLYAAGLGSKTIGKVTVASIQTIYNKPELFDDFNLSIVDECHTIPHQKTGRWHTFFETVKTPVIGFTATPYRLGAGFLHEGEGALFDKIVYTIKISTLQKQGHLALVTSKGSLENGMATKGIKKQGGDFQTKALSDEFDRKAITASIVDELMQYKETRKKWLLFAIDIDHCENIAGELNARGIETGVVHSKMKAPRKGVIGKFKDPDGYQCLVSVAVLTTGFDVPEVDLVGLLRPTQSPTLHVQIIGRGLRPCKGKKDCLVKDFAGNLCRLGPIDNPVVKVKGKGGGEPIMKMCQNCGEIVHAAVRVCPECETKFLFKHHLYGSSKESEVMLEPCKSEWYEIEQIEYEPIYKVDGTGILMVRYICGMKQFKEPVCVEHVGYAKYKANHWWGMRSSQVKSPDTLAGALEVCDELKKPSRIFVDDSGKYPKIEEYDFD